MTGETTETARDSESAVYTIRNAMTRDLTTVVEFINEFATYLRMAGDVKITNDALNDILFVKKRAYVLLFECNREPVGFCLWYPVFSSFSGVTSLHVEDVFIRASHRGKGLGRQVFRYLSNLCSNQGMRGIVWKCLKKNTPAVEFYRHIGATAVDDCYHFELKNDSLDKMLER